MGRSPCCDHQTSGLKKGPWTPEEDKKLVNYITKHGYGCWRSLPKLAGLNRCGKSCRLRWTNYLRPDIKRGKFSEEEERIIINLHSALGNKWSKIANHLPGRTDNEIKNYWNTHLRKKLLQMGIDPNTHKPRTDLNQFLNISQLLSSSLLTNLIMNNTSTTLKWDNALKFQAQATDQLVKIQLLQNLFQAINSATTSTNSNISLLNGSQSFNPSEAGNVFSAHGSTSTSLLGYNNANQHPGFVPCHDQVATDSQATHHDHLINSWGGVEGGGAGDGSIDIYPRKSKGMIRTDSTEEEIQYQNVNPLPALVDSEPLIPENGTNSNQMDNKINSTTKPTSSVFEAWDKLMDDDEASESYWKDILESMAELPTPLSL